ncbi:uncharacterized protein LOC122248831 isoform X2 [Penaeus japonicus]|uniref:uncharacterized protein LOC122248831 isoform X2 n=1 Tax=Penaeus japonicus TaxID=27405 RepID=UPI001C70C559|nr:uncharacterized protein LOC122248831 isoform X2 [Penaeus japonicus]
MKFALVFILAVSLSMVAAQTMGGRPSCPNPNQGRQCKTYKNECFKDFQCMQEGKGDKCCLVNTCGKECMIRSIRQRSLLLALAQSGGGIV